jgi:hypothetical protein
VAHCAAGPTGLHLGIAMTSYSLGTGGSAGFRHLQTEVYAALFDCPVASVETLFGQSRDRSDFGHKKAPRVEADVRPWGKRVDLQLAGRRSGGAALVHRSA